jgi:hypothetical protein
VNNFLDQASVATDDSVIAPSAGLHGAHM